MSTVDDTPVVLLGSGLTALGVMRCFGRRGIEVYSAAEGLSHVRQSRWFRRAPAPHDAPDPRTALARYLERLPFERAVLVPTADSWVRRVAHLNADIGARFPSTVSPLSVLARLMDKQGLLHSLNAAKIPHPRTHRVTTRADLERLPESAFQGAFLKPTDSESFLNRYGVKALHVRTRADACQRLVDLQDRVTHLLLQEYIPGSPSNHYFIDGFIDRTGKTIARFARQRLRMFPADFGNSTYMRSVALTEVADAVESLDRLLAHVQYRGIFSAEFKLDDRDGLFKVLEVNVRPWWYVEFAARCGVDVCYLAYQDALGSPTAPIATYRVGKRLLYPYNDYFGYRALRRRRELSLGGWLRSWIGSAQPVFRWNDPMPAVGEFWRFLVTRFRARRPYRGPERRRSPRPDPD